VTRPSVHVPETIRRTEVGQETEELKDGLGELSRPCPESVPVAGVGSGIGLLGVDEPGEFERVADEEDGGVWGKSSVFMI
jgi:pantothenate kinase